MVLETARVEKHLNEIRSDANGNQEHLFYLFRGETNFNGNERLLSVEFGCLAGGLAALRGQDFR